MTLLSSDEIPELIIPRLQPIDPIVHPVDRNIQRRRRRHLVTIGIVDLVVRLHGVGATGGTASES